MFFKNLFFRKIYQLFCGRKKKFRGAIKTQKNSDAFCKKKYGKLSKFFIRIVIAIIFLLIVIFSKKIVWPLFDRKIEHISILNELKYQEKNELLHIVDDIVKGKNFFNLNLNIVREQIEGLGWIKYAEIRKVWPKRLEVTVEEYTPIAYWNKNSFVSRSGKIFVPKEIRIIEDVPVLVGPNGSQVEVFKIYKKVSKLLNEIGILVSEISLDQYGILRVKSKNKLLILINKETMQKQLETFVFIYNKELKGKKDKIKRVDLRYSNSLAVQWN